MACFANALDKNGLFHIMRDLGAELLGLIPLDADDEGLNPVGVQVSVADIYQFFESRIQAREVQQAREILAQKSKR